MTEPQFNQYAPAGLAFNVTRARIAGKWKRPLPDMADEISEAAQLLSDVAPDLIVFHCTDTSMSQGPKGEGRIADLVQAASGVCAETTSHLVLEAFQALGLRRLLLLTPYQNNRPGIDYLNEAGLTVVHDVALALSPSDMATLEPKKWTELACKHDRDDADGIFLSCTNTTQLEAVEDIERTLGKPVVNSNQAVLWGCIRRLRSAIGRVPEMRRLGQLMRRMDD